MGGTRNGPGDSCFRQLEAEFYHIPTAAAMAAGEARPEQLPLPLARSYDCSLTVIGGQLEDKPSMTTEQPATAAITRATFTARAVYVGERIDLRKHLPAGRVSAQQPATVPITGGGVAVVFRYGAVIFFDVAPADQESFLRELAPLVEDAYDRPETEDVSVCVHAEKREGVEGGTVIVRNASIERLQVVAAALGKSVALAQYEADVAANFDRIEPFAVELEQRGRGGPDMRLLLRHIGRALLNEHKMVARVEVSDRPELLWDHPELEQLYLRLEDEFELQERTEILDRKLELISRTVETILELLQRDRSMRVEWYIVILIVLEIVLSVYGLIWR
jgi:required for meiotic nuclear division protein 1